MSFRQVDQRHVQAEISIMQWSPTMDLIAVVSVGEISLHRMSWQKVWTLTPSAAIKTESAEVTCIVWRPDGRVLAAAYKCGKVVLIDIENAEILHVHNVRDKRSTICSLHWTEHKIQKKTASASNSLFYQDKSTVYLPKYYTSPKSFGSGSKHTEKTVDDCKKVKGQTNLNLLIAGSTVGTVYVYAFGIFPCGWFSVDKPKKNVALKIISAAISDDLSVLTAFVETTAQKGKTIYSYRSYDVSLWQNKSEELRIIALKYGQVSSLMSYLENTIHAISEAWEDILLEIDNKLLKYAEQKRKISDGSVSDDFLELLMFGRPSDSLENFLLHDLTENGLKKFGQSIELAYSNIQKLVLKKLQNVTMALYYHLADVKGMVLWVEKFGDLELSSDAVIKAMSTVGSFLMKAIEIQQVIDSSMKNFKAFFRWLYAVILRLSDEPIPPEITKVTQQDLNFVAEFLKENFADEWDGEAMASSSSKESKRSASEGNASGKAPFKLERVGQYLKDDFLTFPPSISGSPWISFINKLISEKDINGVINTDFIFPYYPEKSLVQQHNEVFKAVEHAFDGMWAAFRKKILKRKSYDLCSHNEPLPFKISHATCLKTNFFLSMFQKEGSDINYLYMLQESLQDPDVFEGLVATFGELPVYGVVARSATNLSHCPSHSVVDAKFYSLDTITVLLMECSSPKTDCPVLVQMQLKSLRHKMKEVVQNKENADVCSTLPLVEGESFIDKSGHKRLENMRAISVAVSGPRKVASVLFASRRQVRIYEMEVEEEDEDASSDDSDSESGNDEKDTSMRIGTSRSSSITDASRDMKVTSGSEEPHNLALSADERDPQESEMVSETSEGEQSQT